MEEYPEEWRTPPVNLVALVGCADVHASVTKHLHSQQPPINTLAFPNLSDISLLLNSFNKVKEKDKDSHNANGFLKRDWLIKHRTKIPAVLAVFFPSHYLSGDPTQWLQVCSDLDNLKAVLRPKNIKLIVVMLHSSSDGDISEDRIIALRKRAEVDAKYLIVFNPLTDSQLTVSIDRLATALAELALLYYKEQARKIKTSIEKKTFNSMELNVRYCIKVAVYAEFRGDWAEALKFYEDAYNALKEAVGASSRFPAIQRLVEIKIVAEHLNFKISTLLLHGGKMVESVTWFRQHKASYGKLVGAPTVLFLHGEWMSRQYLVFAELLDTSSLTNQSNSYPGLSTAAVPLTECEFYPAYYYQLAAHYLKEKRSALEFATSMSEISPEVDSIAESVVPSLYVGQFARLLEEGNTFTMLPLTDDEYTSFAIAEGKRFQDSFEIIALLKKCYDSYSSRKIQRMPAICGFGIAREYFALGDFGNATLNFNGVVNLYRREGWVNLLWDVLGYLRECSRKLSVVKDFIEYSLEMAALPILYAAETQALRFKECGPGGPASLSGRENIHKEVFGILCGEIESSFNLTEDNPLHLEIDLVSPLRSVLLASVAFHEQTIKPGTSSLITLSLLSQLPLTTEIDHLEVQFNRPECNFVITNAQRPQLTTLSKDLQGCRIESASSLALLTNKWLRLTYEIKSEQSGRLECISVTARMGPHFTICCRAESPASMEDLALWKYEDRVEALPTKDPAVAFSGQRATQVEEPEPQVDLALGASGPALVGEGFVMPVTITSKGHAIYSGELKINIVDVRGGGLFSPREAEPFSMESHHVELCSIVGQDAEDESQVGTDNIKQIQQSFGLVSVPFLREGESWSCKLEIKWYRPKPVMLFVSLGYLPHDDELITQKVHIHKSLQIEGKTPIVFGHRFLLPFRRDPLMLSRIKPVPDSDQMPSLPLNETSVLLVSAKNCSEIPLKLLSMSIKAEDNSAEQLFSVHHGGEDILDTELLVPGEEFKKVFTIIPKTKSSKLSLGVVDLKWRRYSMNEDQYIRDSWVSNKYELPDVNVEASPMVITLECPPYAILGDPFKYYIKICNQTQLLQEVKFTLADAQSFVICGSHSDTVFVLPKSEYILSYKIVPLSSGLQQLPKVTIISVRYSAELRPSTHACTVFVFPTVPHNGISQGESN